jgi:uncharacterized membrane protein YgcG
MKTSLMLAAVLGAGVMVTTAGCLSSAHRSLSSARAGTTVALAVTVNGSAQPTAAQWVAIKATLAPTLAARGWILVDDLRQADQILRVDFTPSPADPENSGRAIVLGLRPNPTSFAGMTYMPTSYSYGYSGQFFPGYSYYGSPYNNYGQYWDYPYGYGYGYGGGGGAVVTPPVTPNKPTDTSDHHYHRPIDPNNPPPNRDWTNNGNRPDRGDHPDRPDHPNRPDNPDRGTWTPGQYAGHRDHDGDRPSPPDRPGRPPRSDDSGSRPTYASSGSSYSPPASSSSGSSSSGSSYSAPASSSYSSSSSSSDSSSFSSGGSSSFSAPVSDSSSSGSVGGGAPGAVQNEKQN